jgi:oxygen-dependent protoporphyrinogen oxidase
VRSNSDNHATASKRIAIIGGGISGLAAAFFAREHTARRGLPAEVVLLEEQPRLGGVIETICRDDFLIECGPDSFITEKPWALALTRELGLESEMIGTREQNRRAYVVCRGRLAEIPPGFFMLGPTRLGPLVQSSILSPLGKLRAGLDLLLPRGRAGADESVASFVLRRFGRETLDRLAQPLTSAVYGVAPDRLSVKAAAPRFLELEQRYRSVILGLRALARARATTTNHASGARLGLFVSFRRGMTTLVEALARSLGERALVRARANALVKDGLRWRVELSASTRSNAEQTIVADGVIIATQAPEAARLTMPHAPKAARLLEEITYSRSTLVTLAYPAADVAARLHGSGFVVPRIEGRRIIACTFSSLKFPGRAPTNCVLVRASVDGQTGAGTMALGDAELGEAVRAELENLLGLRAAPLFCHVQRHNRAMPEYVVGHLERVDAIQREIEAIGALELCGAAYRGIGIADCVRSGEIAAQGVIDYLFGRDAAASGSDSRLGTADEAGSAKTAIGGTR